MWDFLGGGVEIEDRRVKKDIEDLGVYPNFKEFILKLENIRLI